MLQVNDPKSITPATQKHRKEAAERVAWVELVVVGGRKVEKNFVCREQEKRDEDG